MTDRTANLLGVMGLAIADRIEDVARDVLTVEKNSPDFTAARVLERLALADKAHNFRMTWVDDTGDVQISNLLGPYKGGLRSNLSRDCKDHVSVTLSKT